MSWRKGKIRTSKPRSYAACGSADGKLIIEIPIVFISTGARPIIVQNLRLVIPHQKQQPLAFNAIVEKIGTDEGRRFATQFPVKGLEAKELICEFQRNPGKLVFEAKRYSIKLEAILDNDTKWRKIGEFELKVTDKDLKTINKQFIVHDNY
ncbi:hypothetical protein JW887_03625 [Candidatus Dojkabacteria bacterium]|nr:hypothetical protein [Candidatus Dojkabacteria bacterium]